MTLREQVSARLRQIDKRAMTCDEEADAVLRVVADWIEAQTDEGRSATLSTIGIRADARRDLAARIRNGDA